MEILRGMDRTGDLIFPLSNMAMLQMLRGAAGNGYVVHGFRSAFRDWAAKGRPSRATSSSSPWRTSCPTRSRRHTGARLR